MVQSFIDSWDKLVKTKENYLTFILVLFLFFLHFYLNLSFSRPAVDENDIALLVTSLNNFMDSLSFNTYTQVNFYLGVLWPAIPIIQLIGESPDSLRILISFFMALNGPIILLALKEVFSFEVATGVIFLVFSTSYWITFFTHEMSIILFFMSIGIYLGVRWIERNEVKILYLLAFVSGLGFYLKAIYLYPIIGLALGFIIARPKELRNRLSIENILVLFLIFILTSLPFLIYSVNTNFWYINDLLAHPAEESSNLEDYSGQGERQGWIFREVCETLSKDLGSFCHILGIRTANLIFITEPVLDNYFDSLVFDFGYWHMFYFLLIAGAIGAIKSGNLTYLYSFIVTFILTLYVIYEIAHFHLVALIPLYPFLIGFSIKLIPGSPNINQKIFLLLSFTVFLLSLSVFHSALQDKLVIPEAQDRYTADRPDMITQKEFEEFESFETDILLTNSHHMYLLGSLNSNIDEVFYFKDGVYPLSFDGGGRVAGVERGLLLTLEDLENLESGYEVKFILSENHCSQDSNYYDTHHCGYTTSEVLDSGLDLEEQKTKDFRNGLFSYRVYDWGNQL